VGPTAVGKTAVAIELAGMVSGEIVSADSMAVYRGMDIGTATPTVAEMSRARFHLLDVVDPTDGFSAGQFQKLAHQVIDDLLCNGTVAIVVGGSGLYVRAAVDGIDTSLPADDQTLRKELTQNAETYGRDFVHKLLRHADPVSAERIHPANLKRVIRALEIYRSTGIPASSILQADKARRCRYSEAMFFGLSMSRELLIKRIDLRVDEMVRTGLVQEVSELLELGVSRKSLAMQALGYKEIVAFFAGETSLDEAVALIKINTRRFAKRQLTWFRADKRIRWIDATEISPLDAAIMIKEKMTDNE
jgi:tRNA dimethylallyltransferase